MDEIALRAVVVAIVVVVVFGSVAVMRTRSSRPIVTRRRVELEPGVYFFSSVACAECKPARDSLRGRLGGSEFVEYQWEHDAKIFAKLRIDGVPATMVVHDDRSATVQFGSPDDSFPL